MTISQTTLQGLLVSHQLMDDFFSTRGEWSAAFKVFGGFILTLDKPPGVVVGDQLV